MNIHANDGVSQTGQDALASAGFTITTTNVAQEQLVNYINENNITGLLVRSATTARKELIDACPGLKLIGRGGVGMDNIDVDYAREKGLHVINTPAASSASVAELVFAHLFGAVRFLYDSNRNMPLDGETKFKSLKKAYAGGIELRGKTLGVIGFGRIGQATAKMALGLGMDVAAYDPFMEEATIAVDFFDGQSVDVSVKIKSFDEVLAQADFVTLHVPAQDKPTIGAAEMAKMKEGAGLINLARGGVVDEEALIEALDNDHLGFAEVFWQ